MNNAPDETKNKTHSTLLAMAAIWVLGFITFYVTRPIENDANLTRWALWEETPNGFLDAVLILCHGKSGETIVPAGWQFLGQRIEPWLLTAFVWLAAWAIGCLLLRLIIGRKQPFEITRCEKLIFACGIGISCLSLVTLIAGLLGLLTQVGAATFGILAITGELGLRWRFREDRQPDQTTKAIKPQKARRGERHEIDPRVLRRAAILAALAPFVILMIWAAALPSTVFDVKEYHLQGPKEWYQNGQITFLEHNVYTSFPFLTEMLSLFSMTLRDDWFSGALVGKSVLMGFVLLTGLACFAATRRWCSEAAGWAAAFVYLTIPWTTTMASTAYVEGALSFFVIVTIHAGLLAVRHLDLRLTLVSGLLAGSAMACKYPGLVSVVLPVGIGLATGFARRSDTANRWQNMLRVVGLYTVGVSLTIGPWLVKNTIQTGNPVYPLAWSVLGGEYWSSERNSQWSAAHSPPEFDPGRLFFRENGRTGWLLQPIVGSDGLSMLLFALAPLAFLRFLRPQDADRTFRSTVITLSLYIAWFILSWWALTHRIDRFWIPMLPVVAVLAGIGWTWTQHKVWTVAIGLLAAATWVHHLALAPHYGTRLPHLSELSAARVIAARQTAASIQFINESITHGELPADVSVLSVGDAEVFDAQFPIRYETVFNESIFAKWVFQDVGDSPESPALRPPAEIRKTLSEAGITHILVDWGEIMRYRATYGYNAAITPAVFNALQSANIVGSPRPIEQVGLYQLADSQRQRLIELGWVERLIVPSDRGPLLTLTQLYPVNRVSNPE